MSKNFVLLLVLVTVLGASCSEPRYPGPLSPEASMETFQLRDGFKIEIFATEPHVLDPVEMIFDEQGNIFVVEMPDYPYKPEPGEGKGRIKLLRDTDGDGRIDESIVFADSLSEATSIMPWKGGLLVTTAPHILYLKDTNGDFQADTQEVLFSGFFEHNSEAQITNLRFGVDNWIYAANHGQAGEVTFSRKPEAPALSMQGADFRFRLDREAFEQETGPAQFGHAMNDWGHRFMTQNTLHIRQAVIPWRYTHRHDHMPSTNAVFNVSDHELEMFQQTPPPYWRAERTRRRNEQYQAQKLDRVEYAEDHFTGASGGTVYDGDAFPEEYYGNIFTAEVAGNLIHRDVLRPSEESPVYVASRGGGETDREFLASTDPWFRPTNFTVGPDGYLYVLDMYRQHIETPVSIPDDLKEDMDFLNGMQHGRIYRIVPDSAHTTEKAVANLRDMEADALVKLLAHPNRWWRLQAQRLLLERQDMSVKPTVETMLDSHEDPRARLHALYVLEGLNALNAAHVRQAMQDDHPGVREHGMILSERFEELLPQLIESTADSSIRVALQATLSLGAFEGREVTAALANVVEQYGEDPWFRIAVLSSEAGASLDLMNILADKSSFFQDTASWKISFLEDFAYVTGKRYQEKETLAFLDMMAKPAIEKQEGWQAAVVSGLVKGLKTSQASERVKETLQTIEAATDKEPKAVMQDLRNLYSSL